MDWSLTDNSASSPSIPIMPPGRHVGEAPKEEGVLSPVEASVLVPPTSAFETESPLPYHGVADEDNIVSTPLFSGLIPTHAPPSFNDTPTTDSDAGFPPRASQNDSIEEKAAVPKSRKATKRRKLQDAMDSSTFPAGGTTAAPRRRELRKVKRSTVRPPTDPPTK
jgi:hypothetical protein